VQFRTRIVEIEQGRRDAVRDAMKMTDEELVVWVMGKDERDPLREGIVRREFERRVAVAQIKSASWMRWSVVTIAIVGAISAGVQVLAWLYPHLGSRFVGGG
jgi:hypothetical protein